MNEQQQTIIGASTQISGHLQGTEDLVVLGRVDGQISLQHTLTIEPSGIVVADVSVREAVVSGTVVGNISANEAIHIAAGGRVVGDLRAPRVILVDGALFRGNVDMGDVEHAMSEVALREAPARTTTTQVEDSPATREMPGVARPAPRPTPPPRRVQPRGRASQKRSRESLQAQASAAAKAVAKAVKQETPARPPTRSAPLIKKSSKKKILRKVPKPPTTAGKKSRAKRK